jgi:RNA polymerase subunit RPABC4/transcription elongation factor Spt4
MAIKAFCPSCQRYVYLEQDDTAVCPVCSSPLIASPLIVTHEEPEDEKV